jgi:hypothetical protein
MRLSTVWTPRPKRYGTLPKIRRLQPHQMMSRRCRCLTGLGLHRKSEAKNNKVKSSKHRPILAEVWFAFFRT